MPGPAFVLTRYSRGDEAPHPVGAGSAHERGPDLAESQQAVVGGVARIGLEIQIDEPFAGVATRDRFIAEGATRHRLPHQA
jgi:hypothetical protein